MKTGGSVPPYYSYITLTIAPITIPITPQHNIQDTLLT